MPAGFGSARLSGVKAAIAILSNMLATFPSKNQRQSCCDQLLDLELFDSSPAMGWGGKGKGCWHRHHHHGGIGLGGAVAEAALIGTAAVAGAAVASAVAPPPAMPTCGGAGDPHAGAALGAYRPWQRQKWHARRGDASAVRVSYRHASSGDRAAGWGDVLRNRGDA